MSTRANSRSVIAGDFATAQSGIIHFNTDGSYTYTPAASFSGTDSVNYTVRDAAGATDTGTLTITVDLVNDAPSGADRTVRINGDAAYVFSAADFGFSDAEGNAFAGVKIADLPGQGTLYYDADGGDAANAVAVVQGQSVDVAAIEAGKLFYQPAAGASGLTYANFSFQVQDDGGTAGGGNDTDSSANTITIDVNAAPHLAFIADPDAGFSGGELCQRQDQPRPHQSLRRRPWGEQPDALRSRRSSL